MNLTLLEPANEDGSYRWLIALGNCVVGVHAESGWCLRLGGDVLPLNSESTFVPVGPLLELPVNEFQEFLQRAAAENPSFSEQILGFPRNMLLKHIFHTSYSSYWPERAIAWLATESASWTKFQQELLALSKNKAMPQKMRQQAHKMLRFKQDKNGSENSDAPASTSPSRDG